MRILAWIAAASLALPFVFAQAPAAKDDGKKDAPTPASLLPPPNPNAPEPPKDKLKEKVVKNDKGEITEQYSYYTDDQGREVKHGTYLEFYEGNIKRREVTYKHNLPNGFQRWWHNNGQVWMEFNTKGGVRDGQYQEFDRNGRLKKRVNFKNGRPEGEAPAAKPGVPAGGAPAPAPAPAPK